MCLALPLRLVEINGYDGVGEFEGVKRAVRLDFIPDPKIGEYVMIHAGFAIERLKAEDALADIEAFKEVEDALSELNG